LYVNFFIAGSSPRPGHDSSVGVPSVENTFPGQPKASGIHIDARDRVTPGGGLRVCERERGGGRGAIRTLDSMLISPWPGNKAL
jgi:hypothetical protein